MKNIILSIRPKFVEKILTGEKTFEYRKKLPEEKIEYILIYATVPVQKIVAIGIVDSILSERPQNLWRKTFGASGIDKSFFDTYFKNSERAFAIKFRQILKLNKPIALSDIDYKFPPQSYIYYKGDVQKLLVNTTPLIVKNKLIFLGGVHGTGKSTYSQKILSAFGYTCISASELIKNYDGEVNTDKTVSNIDNNQLVLLAAMEKFQRDNYKVVIDGHFCILNKDGVPENISHEVFRKMKPDMIILGEIDEKQLKKNLQKRENFKLSVSLGDFIFQEHKQADLISSEMKIEMKVINTFESRKKLIKETADYLK